jgi:hypothetical protein
MTMAWSPLTLTEVAAAGDLTQLFPSQVTAGDAGTTFGSQRRKASSGVLLRAEVYTVDGVGGEIELWDVAGLTEGANNNVNTGTALTDAYLQAEIAAGRARLLWTQGFAGAVGSRYPVFNQRVPFMRGLAARFISAAPAGKTVQVSVVADGGYVKTTMAGL